MKTSSRNEFVEARRTMLVGLGLAACTLAVYWQVRRFEFTNYDEGDMILDNPIVLSGLTLAGIVVGADDLLVRVLASADVAVAHAGLRAVRAAGRAGTTW